MLPAWASPDLQRDNEEIVFLFFLSYCLLFVKVSGDKNEQKV